MRCDVCAGACCEEFELKAADVAVSSDVRRWLRLHSVSENGGWLRFNQRCSQLSSEGRCAIYADRPGVCRDYQPGGVDCLDAVRRRRSAEDYARIRGAGDPLTLV